MIKIVRCDWKSIFTIRYLVFTFHTEKVYHDDDDDGDDDDDDDDEYDDFDDVLCLWWSWYLDIEICPFKDHWNRTELGMKWVFLYL